MEDKPEVTVAPPLGAHFVSSFLNIRVADIAAVYESWSELGRVSDAAGGPWRGAALPDRARSNEPVGA